MNALLEVLGGILVVVLLVVACLTIRDIFRRGLGMGKTSAWLLIVILVPLLGAIAYWVTRKSSPDEVERVYDNERALRESAQRRPVDNTYLGP
jgi:ABC-type transport system involved in cytochrome bd biosynthesis fused ATPase/permease subunit